MTYWGFQIYFISPFVSDIKGCPETFDSSCTFKESIAPNTLHGKAVLRLVTFCETDLVKHCAVDLFHSLLHLVSRGRKHHGRGGSSGGGPLARGRVRLRGTPPPQERHPHP